MRKRDRIFWIAAVIVLAAVVIAALTGDQRWFFLLIAAYLLRPTLAALGVARGAVDERLMVIHYRSGNIAFAVMIVASVVMAVVQRRSGSADWQAFIIVVLLGLAAKSLFSLVLVRNYREAGSRVIMAVGVLGGLYVLSNTGLTLAGLAAFLCAALLVGMGWLAPKFPKPVGAMTFVAAFILMGVILNKGRTVSEAVAVLLVCVPLLLAAASLFAFGPGDTDNIAADAGRD